jgi:hypothetical protein
MNCFRGGGVGVLLLAVGLSAVACGNSVSPEDGRPCRSEADCGDGERCDLGAYTRIIAVCSYAACGSQGECPEGLACMAPPAGSQTPGWGGCPPLVCAPRCTEASCPTGQVCRESGICEVALCNEPGVEACPSHWRCDPPAASSEPSAYESGSVIEDTLDARNSITRGCVRLRCDETDGYACKEFWECAPSEIEGGSGCVPIPCGESGHCENDDFICEPTSATQRPAGADFFGCAFRNCEEGNECLVPPNSEPWVAYCDPSASNADDMGCALRTCAEGNTCVEGYVCDPESPDAGRTGCVPGPGNGSGGGIGAGGGVGVGGSGGSGGSISSGGSVSSGGSAGDGTGGSSGDGSGGAGAGSGSGGASSNGSGGGSAMGEGRCVAG